MKDSEKKLTDSSKKVAEIRRVLCDNSNNKLAEMLGTTPQIVSNLVSGRRNLGIRTAEKILAAFPQLSREWLYTGEGPMLVSEGNGNAITQVGGNIGGNVSGGGRLMKRQGVADCLFVSLLVTLRDGPNGTTNGTDRQ